ncbi:MAG: type IV pilus assembly protein PilM [Candidatus Pacebacteria bacterium]|nr:type IV pilus assembly protein PilM [Candidatus Paceibacterota bacterium]
MFLFSDKSKRNNLGIDVGTKSVRVVELSGKKGKPVLENYGELNLDIAASQSFRNFDKSTLNPSVETISRALKAILDETGIKAKRAVFSLPDFSTFFVSFELPPMSKKDLDNAIGFEARKHIPLPLSEIDLDWQCMSKDPTRERNKIVLMAIPRSLINQYKTVAESVGLQLIALEAEALSSKRVLFEENFPTTCIVEIGYQSTAVSIVDNNFIKTSFSFDIAGKDLTLSLAETLNIDIAEAEQIKRENGLLSDEREDVPQILVPIISLIVDKIKKVIIDFQEKERAKVKKVFLAGGTAQMFGLLEYFKSVFDEDDFSEIEIEMAKSFSKVSYPPILEGKIKELNPTFAIALGEALKNFK